MVTTPVYTTPTAVMLDPVPTAVVRHSGVTMTDLAPLFDAGYSTIARAGLPIAGAAFAVYHGDPAATFDLELGFPIAAPLDSAVAGEPRIEPGTLPGGPALTLSHLGSYDGLGASWGRVMAAALERGATPVVSSKSMSPSRP